MKNVRLTIEYDGTNYLGWQRQRQGPTIQDTIENALKSITNENVILTGSGRTDSGVHAFAQVANFKTNSSVKPIEFQKGLNSALPKDVVILSAEDVDSGFHAQYSAKSKVYLYRILNRPFPSALLRQRTWHVPYELDLMSMRETCKILLGKHDFRAFAQTGNNLKTTTRTVLDATIEQKGDMVELTIEADGFLKRMVRLLTGALVQVGRRRITPEEFHTILDAGEKPKFALAAPACGLYLKEVRY